MPGIPGGAPPGLITEELAPTIQSETAQQSESRERFLAILRLEVLFFERIEIPDTYLFHGTMLLDEFDATTLPHLLGDSGEGDRVRLHLRTGDFASSLKMALFEADEGRLRPLELRYLGDRGLEAGIAGRLAQLRPQRLPTLREYPSVLISLGASDERARQLGAQWSKWQASLDSSPIVRSWPSTTFDLAKEIRATPMGPDSFLEPSSVELYQEVVDLVTQSGDTRSASFDALRRSWGSDRSPEVAYDIETIATWYSDARQGALADFYGSNLTLIVPPDLGDGSPDGRYRALEPDEALSSEAMQLVLWTLASMDPAQFRDLLASTSALRLRWLLRKDASSLRELVRSITAQISEEPRSVLAELARQQVIFPATGAIGAQLLWAEPFSVAAGGLLGMSVEGGRLFLGRGHRHHQTRVALTRWAEHSMARR
jgi:hypothetical protein